MLPDGDIPSGSEVLLNLLQVSREAQILVKELNKDGFEDLRNEFTGGGSAMQPVILQAGVGLSCYQCLILIARAS